MASNQLQLTVRPQSTHNAVTVYNPSLESGMQVLLPFLERVGSSTIGAVTHASDQAIACAEHALRCAQQSIESTEAVAKKALDTNREISVAAIQSCQMQHAQLADVTKGMMQVFQWSLQSAREDREIERKARREAKISELSQQRQLWHALSHMTPEQMVAFAGHVQAGLTQCIDSLEGEKKAEAEEIGRIAREKLEADKARSRTERIHLAKRCIEKSCLEAQQNQQNKVIFAVFISILPACAVYYYTKEPLCTVAALVATLYFVHPRQSDFAPGALKIRWLKIYEGALERLLADGDLSVRLAVKQQLADDRTIQRASFESAATREALEKIPDLPIPGDPKETTVQLPPELRSLTDHAQQDVSAFATL